MNDLNTRLLLDGLPPELRRLIYSQTVSESNTPTKTGLSFQNKTYDSSHTLVELTPVHYGNPGLLALQRYNFLEGDEYAQWLLSNGVQLRIKVLFKGHLNTFVQEHWDKKIAAHLKNLAKKHPWLRRVTDYDIRIAWKPVAWTATKKAKRIGVISKRMVEVLTQEMDAAFKAKRGHVRTAVHVADFLACDYVLKGQELGLGPFVWGTEKDCACQVREVAIVANTEESACSKTDAQHLPAHLQAIPEVVSRKQLGKWQDSTTLTSVFKHSLRKGQSELTRSLPTDEDDEPRVLNAFEAIAREISRFGRADIRNRSSS